MITHQYFVLFFVVHHLGDYYLQTGTIAMKKSKSYKYTFYHVLLYAVPFIIFYFLNFRGSYKLILLILINVITHLLIDLFKCYVNIHYDELKSKGHWFLTNNAIMYFTDQLVHDLILLFTIVYFKKTIQYFAFPLSRDLNEFKLITLFIGEMMFQPGYVSVKIINMKDKSISNCYSKKDLGLKILGTIIGMLVVCNHHYIFLSVLFAYTLLLIIDLFDLLDKDLIRFIFGTITLSWFIYALVFLSMVYLL